MSKFIKSGSSSLLIGNGHYGKYVSSLNLNKLLKITKVTEEHNEFKILPYVKRIENYENYYCIPEDLSFIIKPSDHFYEYIKSISLDEDTDIFVGNQNLQCNFIQNAGNYELLDTINELFDEDFTFWTSYNNILLFAKQLMLAIHYLHNNKICHLDIKPENIIVNKLIFSFKLIDFGFSSIEPFDDFIKNPKGTPGYFPRDYGCVNINDIFPQINANDMISVLGIVPVIKHRKLIYKIDSFCFGRVLYCLMKTFENHKESDNCCFSWKSKSQKKIQKICNDLLDDNVYTRSTIKDCLIRYCDFNSYI
jgi:serine/threonine protein kinase